MALIRQRGGVILFWCPACREIHPFEIPRWTWNQSAIAPTFSPSLRMVLSGCHLVITNGIINYQNDCPHDFRGRAVPMVDLDKILGGTMEENDTLDEGAPTPTAAPAPAKSAPDPEPGMKRCPSCNIYYPGGYERCPNDNTTLV